MLDKIKPAIEKINHLSLRERILVLLACLIVMQQAWDSLVWIPANQQHDALVAKETRVNEDMLQLQIDLKLLTAESNQDPDRDIKRQIATLENHLISVKKKIDETQASLVSPSEMAKLLEQLLISEKSLELRKLETLDSVALIPVAEKAQNKGSFQVYRHGFSIEFEGSYMATLRYIEALEKLPWKFFWDGVEYRVEQYPGSVVKLNLYTLSLSEGWIGV